MSDWLDRAQPIGDCRGERARCPSRVAQHPEERMPGGWLSELRRRVSHGADPIPARQVAITWLDVDRPAWRTSRYRPRPGAHS